MMAPTTWTRMRMLEVSMIGICIGLVPDHRLPPDIPIAPMALQEGDGMSEGEV